MKKFLFILLACVALTVQAEKYQLPLEVQEIVVPEGGFWVGKKFDLKVVLKGSVEDLKDLDVLALRIDDPNTDYRISSKLDISNTSGKNTFTFRNLKIVKGKPAADYEVEIIGIKKGHPPLYHDDIGDYVTLYYEGNVFIDSEFTADTKAPELLSFTHGISNNVVKLVIKASDETKVTEVSAFCMMGAGENNSSGGFFGFKYNKKLDQWEEEFTLDSKNRYFSIQGSVGLGDSLNNYAVVDAFTDPVVYEYTE